MPVGYAWQDERDVVGTGGNAGSLAWDAEKASGSEFHIQEELAVQYIIMNQEFAKILYNILPKLSQIKHKGDNGRIGVIGGSFEFTGAPYFTAMSSLKSGGDLAHIFCAKSAAIAIKSYSPEIIVHPVFTLSTQMQHQPNQSQLNELHDCWLKSINTWKNAITSWVVGPGLGRDKHMDTFFPKLVRNFTKDSLVLFDADGIYYLCQYPELLKELEQKCRVILTPNHRELGYLRKHIKVELEETGREEKEDIYRMDKMEYNYGFNILVKGEYDYYLTNKGCFKITAKGGNKRCGGIGDVLAGATITCASWNLTYGPLLACWLVKKATRKAFEKERRGMTAPTVLAQLCSSFIQVEDVLESINGPHL